jgi:hypothetical protein
MQKYTKYLIPPNFYAKNSFSSQNDLTQRREGAKKDNSAPLRLSV